MIQAPGQLPRPINQFQVEQLQTHPALVHVINYGGGVLQLYGAPPTTPPGQPPLPSPTPVRPQPQPPTPPRWPPVLPTVNPAVPQPMTPAASIPHPSHLFGG
jgi:hypothetical protein